MESLRISILQTDIVWENKQENLRRLREKLEMLCGETEIVVLPEMFSTGFSMNTNALAEPVSGNTLSTLHQWAVAYGVAIAGSFPAYEMVASSSEVAENASPDTVCYYNRAFFLTPEGESYFYDKRHLFRMGDETRHFTAGIQRPVITYRGWNILLLVCYDLRFPVWSRNVNNAYDVLVYVANWPLSRRMVWDTLLQARALENQCYVCGVNRIGSDGNGLCYNGGSIIYSPKGVSLARIPDHEEGVLTATLSLPSLREFRNKFPVWEDADSFTIG